MNNTPNSTPEPEAPREALINRLIEAALDSDASGRPDGALADIALQLRALSTQPAPEAASVVPEGWKLVPMNATADMVRAGWELLPSSRRDPWDLGATLARQVWNAMLSASPPLTAPAAPEAVGESLGYATRLAEAIHAKHFADVTQWRPLPDLLGVLTQIDNMTSGLSIATPLKQEGAEPVATVEMALPHPKASPAWKPHKILVERSLTWLQSAPVGTKLYAQEPAPQGDKRDAERIDWLEKQNLNELCFVNIEDEQLRVVEVSLYDKFDGQWECRRFKSNSLRSAIDEAMGMSSPVPKSEEAHEQAYLDSILSTGAIDAARSGAKP